MFDELSPPYSTIVADPPWHYDERVISYEIGSKAMPYSTMTTDEICAMPVATLSRPGAHLYLWTTNRYLVDGSAKQVAEAWGFEPITALVWCKTPAGKGPGGRFSITTEFVLFCRDQRRAGEAIREARKSAGLSQGQLEIAVRGHPTRLSKRWEDDDSTPSVGDWHRLTEVLPDLAGKPYPYVVPSEEEQVESTWFQWPRGAHSVKPGAFLDLVERVSPHPYVELFARQPRLGWDAWGYGFESPKWQEIKDAARGRASTEESEPTADHLIPFNTYLIVDGDDPSLLCNHDWEHPMERGAAPSVIPDGLDEPATNSWADWEPLP